MRKVYAAVVFGLSGLALVAACGSETFESAFVDPNLGDSGNASSSGDPPILGVADGAVDAAGQAFTIAPLDQVLTFTSGAAAPTLQLTATASSGVKVPATFTIDRGE